MVAPAAQAEMSQRLSTAGAQLRATPGGAPTVRSAPVGYRVVSFEPTRAVIGTWEIVARSSPQIVPSVLWARSELTFVWQGSWKLAATTVNLDPPADLSATEVREMDASYRGFRHAP